MAIDLAMVKCYQGVPTLRLYGWRPPAVSLGYHQSLNDIDLKRCHEDQVDVVFRPTGGRAVLHHNEVTYAVVLSRESRLFDSRVLAVYERISRAILTALLQLTSQIQFERAPRPEVDPARREWSSLCFASSIQHEIGYQGKKLIGSAQRRFGNIVLQHGSILLGKEHLKLVDYLAGKTAEQKAAIRQHMIQKTVCLHDLTFSPLSFEEVCMALPAGFEKTWHIHFKPSILSQAEIEQANEERRVLLQKSGYS